MLLKKRISMIIFAFASALILMYIKLEKSKASQRDFKRYNVKNSVLYLENLLDDEEQIVKDKSIFLVDTTRMKKPWKERKLTLRQACSIESAALTNLNSNVFFIFVSPYERLKETKFTQVMRSLLDYPNVYVKSMNLIEFSVRSSYEMFTKNETLLRSTFVKQHTSDFLRLVLLQRYGGIYMDTDIIAIKNLQKLPRNCICHYHGFLNAAFIKLDRTKKGIKFSETFLEDMIQNFNGSQWGWNGPLMLERVVKKVCSTDDINTVHKCDDLNILDQDICYPIEGQNWQKLFDEESMNDVLDQSKRSYMIHFWNKLSHRQKLECDSKSAYAHFAKKYCPKIFKLCHDYF